MNTTPLYCSVDKFTDENITPEELEKQRALWLPLIFEQNPHLLALRENALPWTGGLSFSNIINTSQTASPTQFNRHTLLQIIYQHLEAVGMHKTAETLQRETGHQFQLTEQPWNRTDLLILTSLGLLPREDPWNIPVDPNVTYIDEPREEDFFASSYREDPHAIYQEALDPNLNVVYDKDPPSFSNLRAASLRRLIVLLVTSSNDFMSENDKNSFFLILHTITTSQHFLEHLVALFDGDFSDPNSKEEVNAMYEGQLRVNIVNTVRQWVNFQGLFIGKTAIQKIGQFLRHVLDTADDIQQYNKILRTTISNLETLTYGIGNIPQEKPTVQPDIQDAQILFNPKLSFTDLSPLEVARQITLLTWESFRAVHPREFLEAIVQRKCTLQTPTLNVFFTFIDKLGRLVLESIVFSSKANDPNPLSGPQESLRKVLEICEGLDQLANYAALSVILSQLLREEVITILQYKQEQIAALNTLLNKCGDVHESFPQYSNTIRTLFEESQPAIPNIKAELKEAQPNRDSDFIDGLINWEKKRDLADRVNIFYRLQNRKFLYWPVQQIQKVIKRGPAHTVTECNDQLDKLRKDCQQSAAGK